MMSSELVKPPTWREWKAQNGGKGWYWRTPLAVEWGLEWFVYRLRGLALFDLLELAGRTTVLVVAILWVLEADDRAKERHYRAWELINSARGSTGDGGRRDALQDLAKDGVSLAGALLKEAYLPRVDLSGADFSKANLSGANLYKANLSGANLTEAHLEDAAFTYANISGAYLWANLSNANFQGANLQGADFRHPSAFNDILYIGGLMKGANLSGANFQEANLQGARLHEANLSAADLWAAKLQDAQLWNTNLQGANLEGADMQGANLERADLRGARHLTQAQLDAADGDDWTQLPDGLARPARWAKTKGPDTPPPAPQPDGHGRAPATTGAPGSGK